MSDKKARTKIVKINWRVVARPVSDTKEDAECIMEAMTSPGICVERELMRIEYDEEAVCSLCDKPWYPSHQVVCTLCGYRGVWTRVINRHYVCICGGEARLTGRDVCFNCGAEVTE